MQSEVTVGRFTGGFRFSFRMCACVGIVFFLTTACVSPSSKVPSDPPPAHTKWTRSYTLDEFTQEVFREDAAVRASQKAGVFQVRMLPTPEAWEGIKKSMPEMKIIWCFEPDGSDFTNHATNHMIGGAGFAALDEHGQIKVFHTAIVYGSMKAI